MKVLSVILFTRTHCNIPNRAASCSPPEPRLLGVDVQERDDAAGRIADHGLVACAQVEVLVAVVAVRVSLDSLGIIFRCRF